MGGSVSGGNVTAVAEFNVWQDPEAAKCVIESPIPITCTDSTRSAASRSIQADADRFRAHDHPAIRLAGELLYRRRPRSHDSNRDYVGLLGDAGAMVLLTNPELFVTRELPVRVNLEGIGRGQTIVDQRAVPRDAAGPDPDPWPSIAVVVDLDVAQAAATFVKVIDAYASSEAAKARSSTRDCVRPGAWRPAACTSTMSRPLTASTTCFRAWPGNAPA